MGFKDFVVDSLCLIPVAKGFTVGEARRWTREVFRHRTSNLGFSPAKTNWAIRHGFMPEQVEKLNITKDNIDDFISPKDYAYIRPLNGIYARWLTDRVTVNQMFKPFRGYFPVPYYEIGKRYAESFIIPLSSSVKGRTPDDIMALIKEKGTVAIGPSNGGAQSPLRYEGGRFTLDGKEYTEEKLKERLMGYMSTICLWERVEPEEITAHGVLDLIVFNEYGDDPVIGDAMMVFDDYERVPFKSVKRKSRLDTLDEPDNRDVRFRNVNEEYVDPSTGMWRGQVLPHWNEITEFVDRFCRYVPELEFYCARIIIRKDDFRVVGFQNNPEYPSNKPFSKETSEYLKKKVEQKKELFSGKGMKRGRARQALARRARKDLAKLLYPKDLIPYMSTRWIHEVFRDFFSNKNMSVPAKLAAYRKGFLSYRIDQYGITKDNISEYISDFEYRWLRHINPKYRKWMEDKITVKYICSDNKDCFPEYYYHIILKNGSNKVLSMMDLPEGYTNEFEEIFRLVQEKGVLALKPDEGSHGDGFYKFTCEKNEEGSFVYKLNYKEATKDQVMAIFKDVDNQYLVTEYIDMCDELKAIYPGSVNTVRMLVYKKNGIDPEIGNCYVRIGSSKTGAVDNVGAGGMTAHIDPETGRFHDAKIVVKNHLEDIRIHPDTGAVIDGYLPHWDQVREKVLEVARSIPQMEWFGFDLAVTRDGIKFPEINRFPDFPAVEKYSEGTRDYLLYKLQKKKEAFGYDKKPNKTIIHLPKR